MPDDDKWVCPQCGAENEGQFIVCVDCEHVRRKPRPNTCPKCGSETKYYRADYVQWECGTYRTVVTGCADLFQSAVCVRICGLEAEVKRLNGEIEQLDALDKTQAAEALVMLKKQDEEIERLKARWARLYDKGPVAMGRISYTEGMCKCGEVVRMPYRDAFGSASGADGQIPPVVARWGRPGETLIPALERCEAEVVRLTTQWGDLAAVQAQALFLTREKLGRVAKALSRRTHSSQSEGRAAYQHE